ncbi:TadE/TadG family type IV pilus assembly protein [Frigidibacter sp. MR17.24]|uniref:TadE/TadG family type IV pilus assembly protein n=1 Tax=Frigidibacter sp. MR17.24 TaxID=3127345 RepID=UPI003012E2DF
MTGWLTRLGARARAKWRDEQGNSTIEFIIVFPVFLTLLCSAAESGTLMVRQVMLDRGLDITVRALRLNTWTQVTQDNVRTMLCDSVLAIPNCTGSVLIEMTRIPAGGTLPSSNATCVERGATVTPTVSFSQGGENDLMLIRACAKFDPVLPTIGLGLDLSKDAQGDYALVSTSAFVVEPR